MKDSILNKRFKYTYSNASLILVGINVVVFFLTRYFTIRIGGTPLFYWLSMVPSLIEHGYVWQLFTYMFVHANLSHLFFNMLALIMFGMMLERTIGSREFVLFYLVSGFLSGVISFLIYEMAGTNVVMMGASGAIYALLLLFSVIFPTSRILLFYFIPVQAPIAVLIFAVICVANEMFTVSNTANLTHLAGFAVAWVYCLVRFRVNPIQVWKSSIRR